MGIANDLERLAELHRIGAISDAEFAGAKGRALGETPLAAKNAVMLWLVPRDDAVVDVGSGSFCST